MGLGFLQDLSQAVISSDCLHGHREKNDLGNADCCLLKLDFLPILTDYI